LHWYSETADETNIIPEPLLYALAMEFSSEATRATHLAITHLVVRAAKSLVKTEQSQWTRWIALMLWISIPKEETYLDNVERMMKIRGKERIQSVWDNITMSLSGLSVESPHVQEIAKILWPQDFDESQNLSRAAFTDPQRLVSDVFRF
jgi:hypothetical protein